MAVTRSGVVRLDFDDLVGQDGDVIHLMVTDSALERLNARLAAAGPKPPPERQPGPSDPASPDAGTGTTAGTATTAQAGGRPS